MGMFGWKKKSKNSTTENNSYEGSDSISKDELLKRILEKQAQRTPSEHFASGAVFDISKQNRDMFLNALSTKNTMALQQVFMQSYSLFLEHPECVGFTPGMVNTNSSDTNPLEWNSDFFELPNGTYAALLFMPIHNNNNISARMVGIIFSDSKDGYYYCMLNSKENTPSTVYRNKAMLGVHDVGEVNGSGFELMNNFFNRMKDDFLKN